MATAALKSTSRDVEEYARATALAREVRTRVGAEVFAAVVNVAEQVEELVQVGDVMAGESVLASRLRELAMAKSEGDVIVVRAAVMGMTTAGAAWVAAIDHAQVAHRAEVVAAA